MRFLWSFGLAVYLTSLSHGAVTLFFSAGTFKDENGANAPAGSLILVVADTAGDGFDAPIPGDFLGGSDDDILVSKMGMTVSGFVSADTGLVGFTGTGAPGVGAVSPNFTGSWGAGDRLGLLFVPSLTTADAPFAAPADPPADSSGDTDVVQGLRYGFYSDPGWLTPVDGTTQTGANANEGFTLDSGSGTLPNDTFMATETVIPEPSSTLLVGLGFSVFFLRRRRMRTATA